MDVVAATGFKMPYCIETGQKGHCSSSKQFDTYAMGTDAETVYATFHNEVQTTFYGVLAKFREYFAPKVNVIHERAILNARCQQSGENVEAYARVSDELSQLEREAIRARLVTRLE